MLPRTELLGLLRSLNVDLPRKTKLSDQELDERLSHTLDSAQYISRVVPNPPLDPNAYPSWLRDSSNQPLLGKALQRHNNLEAMIDMKSSVLGVANPLFALSSPAMVLRQVVMAVGDGWDNGTRCMLFQDKDKKSGICIKVLEVKKFDNNTPILLVVFQSSLRGELAETAQAYVTVAEEEQHMLLRILYANSNRLASSYKPKRAAAEASSTLSFLIPVGPLEADDIVKYNANDGCLVCGAPAVQQCSRCRSIKYCDSGEFLHLEVNVIPHPRETACQQEDWKIHRPVCNSVQTGNWTSITFRRVDRPVPGVHRLKILDITHHEDVIQRRRAMLDSCKTVPPVVNTHGVTPFIVKIHVPFVRLIENEDAMVLDEKRTFEVSVERSASGDPSKFDKLVQVVRKSTAEVGMFLYAIRTGDWTIDLCLDSFPDQDQTW
ncbi:hypothetical protein FB45DRAFT_1054033 [Roridomyces roridus]|uniref:MYND-type domain-containing protein n=1 Tax=Roridomyces roridus TaxID=1738132 RepID=A0AAD7FWQ5_9AGAR|nr:hypothetical protein FB45DRAFT_1054033 [Roridomyces roridus]